MNILFLLSQLEVTGAETYIESLSANLIEKGCNIFIASDTFTRKVDAKIYKVPLHNRNFSSRLNNIKLVKKIITDNNIDIVHANSRASAWVGNFACKKLKIPFVVTIHGLSGMRTSKKFIPALGDRTIAVCEEIMERTLMDFSLSPEKLLLIRNGLDTPEYSHTPSYSNNLSKEPAAFNITYLGRLSGPKLDIVKDLLQIISKLKKNISDLKFNIVGGQNIPDEILLLIKDINQKQNEEFIVNSGYTADVKPFIERTDLMIASGRSAIESVLMNTPLIYWGEAKYGGLLSESNLNDALKTNFGDCSAENNEISRDVIYSELLQYYSSFSETSSGLREEVAEQYSLSKNSEKIHRLYKELISERNSIVLSEPLPIILYHKVVERAEIDSKAGIYVTAEMFDKQLSYLKKKKFRTLTFYDVEKVLNNEKLAKEEDIILTFDDGYKNNYSSAFPILKKYGFKCVIFYVAGFSSNEWDKDKNEAEDHLMSDEEISEMEEYGIEFGSHTLTHPHLTQLSVKQAELEIKGSFEILKPKLKKPLISFAYPYGECSPEVKEIVRKSYKFGIATDSGPLLLNEDHFEIRRQILFSHTSMLQFRKKISKWYPEYKLKKQSDYKN
ncbi:polysaccharide deacetylase family protein [soil metagenome]